MGVGSLVTVVVSSIWNVVCGMFNTSPLPRLSAAASMIKYEMFGGKLDAAASPAAPAPIIHTLTFSSLIGALISINAADYV